MIMDEEVGLAGDLSSSNGVWGITATLFFRRTLKMFCFTGLGGIEFFACLVVLWMSI